MNERKVLQKLSRSLEDKRLVKISREIEDKSLDTVKVNIEELEYILGDKKAPPVELESISME